MLIPIFKKIFLIAPFVLTPWFDANSKTPITSSNSNISTILVREKIGATPSLTCEKLSDDFCKYFWSKDSLGNVEFSNGDKILAGDNKTFLLSRVEIENIRVLFESRCRLPMDLKKRLGVRCSEDGSSVKASGNFAAELLKTKKSMESLDLIEQIYRHQIDADEKKYSGDILERQKWRWRYSDLANQLSRGVSQTAMQRTYKRRPDLEGKDWKDLKVPEKREFREDYYALSDRILEVKYKSHPNWLRVVRLFEEAKRAVKDEVDLLDIPSSHKKLMKQKVNSVKLSLPYEHPKVFGAGSNCGNTTRNAFYKPSFNTFTICAGYFNGFRVEGHLFHTIVHEISHAIDPMRLAIDKYQGSEFAKLISRVYESNGRIKCSEWSRKSGKYLQRPKTFFQLPARLDQLNRCLVDRSKLSPLTLNALVKPASVSASRRMDKFATRQWFTKLTHPVVVKEGVEVENEFYLNPRQLVAFGNEFFDDHTLLQGYFDTGSVFVQNYLCIAKRAGIDVFKKKLKSAEQSQSIDQTLISIEKASEVGAKSEQEVFRAAMSETKKLMRIYRETINSYAGRESSGLKHYNLAKTANEAWADWVADNATEKRMRKIKNLSEARLFALSTQASYCKANGINRLANVKTRIERKHSKAVHPLARIRRLRYVTPEIGRMMGCVLGPEIRALNARCDFSTKKR